MSQTTSDLAGQIVGREAELAALEKFLRAGRDPQAFVLTGEPGVGKTTLWEAGIDLARQRGLRVLSTRGTGAETQLSSAALVDLLDHVSTEELAGLPPPQLRALEVALFRADPTGAPPGAHAIALGLLNALRTLAGSEQLVVAIDDVQWLDGASADALSFSARRLAEEPVTFLLARRPGSASPVERALAGRTLERIDLGRLSLGATRRVLSDRVGISLPRNVLRRVFEATLGNPLFTLELGRALAARGRLEVGEDIPLPDTVDELLGSRIAALPEPERKLLLAVALSGELRGPQATELAGQEVVEDAVDAGVLVVDGDRVRPAHPLYATAAKRRARRGERRELHLVLAQLAADEETRARHLALAADAPDEELAASVAAAAAIAAARGSRQDAVVLAEHALRLTPRSSAERNERLLALGGYLMAAGEPHRLTDLISGELDSLPRGTVRARALVLLTDGVVKSNDDIRGYLDEALAESSEDEALHAWVLREIAENEAVIRVQQLPTAEAWALEAMPPADTKDGRVQRHALYTLAWPRALRGRPIDDLCERFRAASDDAYYLAASPDRVAGQRLTWRGDVDGARAVFTQMLALADERGEPYSYVLLRLHLCQLELRVGNWDAAARLLEEWSTSSERVMWPMYERCRALLAAGRGLPDDAERWAGQALATAEATGTNWDRLEALRARGTAWLLTRPALAAESLRAVWEHTEREGVDEPGVFPVAPELVDALVELGELDEAVAVTERLRDLAAEQEHPWGLTTATRCAALVRLASHGYDEVAATELARAAEAYGALGLPFDRARSLLSLGRSQRRLRKWGVARESLEQVAAAFDELDSPGWAEQARSELARVGGRRSQRSQPNPGDLTATEQRVAELAVEGLANAEIAQNLSMSVRTVQVHLKHAYAKLGIRSRTQLAGRLVERA